MDHNIDYIIFAGFIGEILSGVGSFLGLGGSGGAATGALAGANAATGTNQITSLPKLKGGFDALFNDLIGQGVSKYSRKLGKAIWGDDRADIVREQANLDKLYENTRYPNATEFEKLGSPGAGNAQGGVGAVEAQGRKERSIQRFQHQQEKEMQDKTLQTQKDVALAGQGYVSKQDLKRYFPLGTTEMQMDVGASQIDVNLATSGLKGAQQGKAASEIKKINQEINNLVATRKLTEKQRDKVQSEIEIWAWKAKNIWAHESRLIREKSNKTFEERIKVRAETDNIKERRSGIAAESEAAQINTEYFEALIWSKILGTGGLLAVGSGLLNRVFRQQPGIQKLITETRTLMDRNGRIKSLSKNRRIERAIPKP